MKETLEPIIYSYNNFGLTVEPTIDIINELTVKYKNRLRKKVIKQIKDQGFIINKDYSIKTPDMDSKDFLRTFHASACESRLNDNTKFLVKKEERLIDFFANGDEIDIDNFQAKFQVVTPNSIENDLFRYASLLWSVPVSNGFGRRVRFLVSDTSNNKLVGIFALGDPVFNLKCRDDWIGWNSKMREERLYNVLDVFVLGAVPPYNLLLGGKLIAMIAASNEVRDIIKEKYAYSETVMRKHSKDSHLALLTTGSALGKSSLYDRIKYNNRLVYQCIGESVGWGHFHLNHGLFQDMCNYVELTDPIRAHANRFGQGPNWKIRTARLCLTKLGLSGDLLKHGIKREIYGIPLAYNFKEYLKGETNKLDEIYMPFNKVTDYWKERWLKNRVDRKPEYMDFNKNEIPTIIRTIGSNFNGRSTDSTRIRSER